MTTIQGLELVHACGVCVTSFADRAVPKVLWFSVLALVWFLATAIVCFYFRNRPSTFPGIYLSGVLIVAAVLLGSVAAGPILVLALGVLACTVYYEALRNRPWAVENPTQRAVLIRLGSTVLLVAAAIGVWSVHALRTRTKAEFIIAWGGGGASRAVLRDLAGEEPQSLGSYRALLRDAPASCRCLGFVASRIEHMGASSEVPLLIEALSRLEGSGAGAPTEDIEQVNAALRTLTGARLPSDATADDWRRLLR